VDAGVAAVGDDKDKYVEILHRAAEEGSVPRMEVFKVRPAVTSPILFGKQLR
jgi:hypothetical protein